MRLISVNEAAIHYGSVPNEVEKAFESFGYSFINDPEMGKCVKVRDFMTYQGKLVKRGFNKTRILVTADGIYSEDV